MTPARRGKPGYSLEEPTHIVSPRKSRHPVSNDVWPCQGISANTSPETPSGVNRAPFRSRGKGFAFLTKARVLSIVRWTQGLTIHLFGPYSHDSCFELPARSGRQAPTQAVGLGLPTTE